MSDSTDKPIRRLKSCGFLILRDPDCPSFLLMKHADRWDLPKGHVDPGETELVCAFRELEEETGITADDLIRDLSFRYTTEYFVRYPETALERFHKTLVVFLGWLRNDITVRPTEHPDFRWFDWNPPHQIQRQTIDPLLTAVENHLRDSSPDE